MNIKLKLMKTKTTLSLCSLLIMVMTMTTACKKKSVPEVQTAPVSGTGTYWATSGGGVVSDGNTDITEQGICWSTTENPGTSNSCSENFSDIGSTTYTRKLTGLSPNTTYFVRAYARNDKGVGYGDQVSFTTHAGGNNVIYISGGAPDQFSFSIEPFPDAGTYRIKVVCTKSDFDLLYLTLWFGEDFTPGTHSMSMNGLYSGNYMIIYSDNVYSETGTFTVTSYDPAIGKLKGKFDFTGTDMYTGYQGHISNVPFELYI
jgi:hypothetical protein